MSLEDFIMKARNRSSSGGLTKNETAQLNNDNAIETGSNASSTDDYVRELLDPDARPRNVWHLVEGPKISQPEDEKESPEGSTSKPASIEKQDEFSEVRGGDNDEVKDEKKEFDNDKNSDHRSKHSHGERRRSKTSRHHRRSRSKSVSPLRHHRRSCSKSITSSRHHNRRSRSRSITSSSRHRRRSRSRSITSSRHHRRTRSRSRQRSQSPVTKRDSRTILIMQLNPRVDSRDLEDFFSEIGQVREVRLIMDSKTRRHKGIAYIEFEDASSAAKAFSLNGQKFFGAPIVIQSAQMDRNRAVSGNWHSSTSQIINHPTPHPNSRTHLPPNCYRVYVGGLHVNLTEEMIRSVFEPFGPIVRLELMRDRVTAVSRGYAFITYANIEDGQNAVQALDGFELAGKSLRVSKSTDKSERHTTPSEEGRILT